MKQVDEWQAESQLAMHGWDFSHLDGRWRSEQLPWNYRDLVKANLEDDLMWLDVDTGGGELMDSFKHPENKTVVTEGWAPNLKLLREKYANSDVTVIADSNEDLSNVSNNSFDIITNSHGALAIQETLNKLRPSGLFITEQVGATNNFALSRFLDPNYNPAYPDNTLIDACARLQYAGMRVEQQAVAFSKMSFFDVGAIVYYATVIPWEFPNFSVEACLPRLHQLDQLIKEQGSIATFADRFMIVARKPA
ncbi:SAM-dependent methyltransferase [Lactiplantibacillus sp. WILCCON 0030]|uniref:SAM-dependent methyltransferase n=1 Tax=Lactiplantibacillus brownii TaxID=3069269 RepID=A0ABU1A9E8_9LACO|nr:SAM-dependent methyltransferase [Lactiplantibacillus brownii]MDQ7937540.1 SAM-dependent methyltransferase [Lactiplantibacillus brownii]